MVTIVDHALRKNQEGEEFYAIILQGGIEMVKSQETGRYYATAKRASVPSTFDEQTCKSMVGQQMTGEIKKVECEPYEITIKETGEIIELSHRWEYQSEVESAEEAIHEGAVFTAIEA
ncbi:hypothetical protein [uncultured Sunxiuqinia sp.]|uniref:hypothetical protein n=1 Tax=uncultured Sunxiuqinia sp. TaxID=1573825 RepID=UPI002AA62B25|nr:hypothetical protein [uncultured Sunxiuqinia sp.]